MKSKLLIISTSLFFGIVLAILRLICFGNFIDIENGFFKPGYSYLGLILAAFVVVLVVVYSVIALKTSKFPIAPRRGSKTIAVASLILGVVCLINFFGNFNMVLNKYTLIIMVLLFADAAYFILLGLSQFHLFKLSSKYAIIPLFYFLAKLGYCFLTSFGIVGSQQINFEMFCYVVLVLYFLVFSRYLAKSKFKKIRKYFYILSLVAVVVTIGYGLSDMLSFAVYQNFAFARDLNAFDALIFFSVGLYIVVFIGASFLPERVYIKHGDSYLNPKIENNEKVEWDSLEEKEEK